VGGDATIFIAPHPVVGQSPSSPPHSPLQPPPQLQEPEPQEIAAAESREKAPFALAPVLRRIAWAL